MDFKNYFLDNSVRGPKYEDTLPDIEIDENQETSRENHSKEKNVLTNLSQQLFPKLFTLLVKGINVVIYGLGSKFYLLEKFRSNCLENFTVIVSYGYKDVGLRQILASFQEALNCDKADEDTILRKISKLNRPIFLIIHSFDRLCLKNDRIKPLINRILTTPSKQVHLLTSVDHVNSSLLWTCREVDLLNLYWINYPTFNGYQIEKSFAQLSTSRSSGSSKQRSAAATLMAVSNVFDNLPINSQNIFLLILNFYKSHYSDGGKADQSSTGRRNTKANKNVETDSDTDEDDEENDCRKVGKLIKGFEGYPFNQLYLDCMDAFYVNSEATLRNQLVEFIDHKLIRSRTGSDGSEFIELLIQPKLIPKLLQELSH